MPGIEILLELIFGVILMGAILHMNKDKLQSITAIVLVCFMVLVVNFKFIEYETYIDALEKNQTLSNELIALHEEKDIVDQQHFEQLEEFLNGPDRTVVE